jgi:hypothetical protein
MLSKILICKISAQILLQLVRIPRFKMALQRESAELVMLRRKREVPEQLRNTILQAQSQNLVF